MAQVTLHNLVKRFSEDVVAVNNVNLEIDDKEFVVLVGPSGCGKTTTLRMVAGLEDISAGEIYIGDRLVNPIRESLGDEAFHAALSEGRAMSLTQAVQCALAETGPSNRRDAEITSPQAP